MPTRRMPLAVWLVACAVLATLVLAGIGAAPAGAQDASVSGSAAARLARQAITSDAALADLRSVREVDGRAVDMRSATAGIDAADRRTRLEALARTFERSAGGRGSGGAASAARRDAHGVVTGKDYRSKELPKPFRGPLHWLGDRLAPVGHFLAWLARPLVDLFELIPGGQFLLLALLVGLACWGVIRLARRRSRSRLATGSDGRYLVDPTADPDELARQADAAEAAGQFGLAVRRRYEEGLIRLVRAERIQLRPETTASAVAREVGGDAIAALTATFEEVVYGDRPATAADCVVARDGWREVLGVKARR